MDKLNRNNFCEKFTLNKQLYFLPIDYIYRTQFVYTATKKEKSKMKTYVDIIGIVPTGQRALIRATNIPLFVDIICPEDIYAEYVYEYHMQLPGKTFSKPLKYARVYFDNKKDRNDFIVKNRKFQMANSDKHDTLFMRYAGFNTCGWNECTNFTIINTEDKNKLPIQVTIDFKNSQGFIKKLDFSSFSLNLRELLSRDKSIVCSWDLETYSPRGNSVVPLPEISEDQIKMCAMIFRYHWSSKTICSVLIIDEIFKTREETQEEAQKDYIVIYSKDIPMTFSEVLARMQPDFLVAFNDGAYDFPFIKHRITKPATFLKNVSALNLSDFEKQSFGPLKMTGFPQVKRIKIDAETTAVYDAYAIPGCICFDVMLCLRRIHKTETRWSLNHFLSKYDLAAKDDMDYGDMARAFHIWTVCKDPKNRDHFEKTEKTQIPFPDDPRLAQFNAIDCENIMNLITKISDYCVRDAAAVLDLISKICIISDVREFCNLSYTTTTDGFYKADGMKVRNVIYYFSMQARWGSWPEKYALGFDGYTEFKPKKNTTDRFKYTGGHVIKPQRKIYGGAPFEREKNCNLGQIQEKTVILPDRPSSGLDFNSLYPSLIMAYNFSPEYFVDKKQYATLDNELKQAYGEFLEVSTKYEKESDPSTHGNKIFGLFRKQVCCSVSSPTNGTKWTYENHGIFPTILYDLFLKRKGIKADMNEWAIILEKLSRDVRPAFATSHSKTEESQEQKTVSLEQVVEKLQTNKKKILAFAENYNGKKKELELRKAKSYDDAITLITKHWCGFYELLELSQFKYNYFNVKQNALKVFMNTFYGEMGSVDSPFYIPAMSGGVTKMGRRAIKAAKKFVEEHGFRVYYGDSVTGNTPLKLKINDEPVIITIEELFNMVSSFASSSNLFEGSQENEKCYALVNSQETKQTDIKILTETGYTDVLNVMKHGTHKDIYGIYTKNSYVEVTEDHSLLDENCNPVTPKNVKTGDKLLAHSDCENQYEVITQIIILPRKFRYVYDLTTANHHFQAGIGNIIVHNTDSIYISPPEAAFVEADQKYELSQKSQETKEQWYEEMVGITMNQTREISIKVGEYFLKTVGNPFLNMAYEEVLFPYGFFGRKRYFGVKHIETIDFSICRKLVGSQEEAKALEIFTKELFTRGISLRRRDGSQYAKSILAEAYQEVCNLSETRPYEQIILDVLKSKLNLIMCTNKNNIQLACLKTKIKETKKGGSTARSIFKSNNLKYRTHEIINRAVYKMRVSKLKLQELNSEEQKYLLELNIKIDDYVIDEDLLKLKFPEITEGVYIDLIYFKRPDRYNNRGTCVKIKSGDCLCYPSFLGNANFIHYIIKYDTLDAVPILQITNSNEQGLHRFTFNAYKPCNLDMINNLLEHYTTTELNINYYMKELCGAVASSLFDLYYGDEFRELDTDLRKRYKTHLITKQLYKKDLANFETNHKKKIKDYLMKKFLSSFNELKINTIELKTEHKQKTQLFRANTKGYISNLLIQAATESDFDFEKLKTEIYKHIQSPQLTLKRIKTEILNEDWRDYIMKKRESQWQNIELSKLQLINMVAKIYTLLSIQKSECFDNTEFIKMVTSANNQLTFILKKIRIETLFDNAKNHLLIKKGNLKAMTKIYQFQEKQEKNKKLDDDLDRFLLNY